MDILNSYRIDLKNMKSEKEEFWFHLDDVFFQTVDGPEIKSGDLKAHLLVRRTSGAFEFHIDVEGTIQIPCDRCLDMMSLPVERNTMMTASGSPFRKKTTCSMFPGCFMKSLPWRYPYSMCTNLEHVMSP